MSSTPILWNCNIKSENIELPLTFPSMQSVPLNGCIPGQGSLLLAHCDPSAGVIFFIFSADSSSTQLKTVHVIYYLAPHSQHPVDASGEQNNDEPLASRLVVRERGPSFESDALVSGQRAPAHDIHISRRHYSSLGAAAATVAVAVLTFTSGITAFCFIYFFPLFPNHGWLASKKQHRNDFSFSSVGSVNIAWSKVKRTLLALATLWELCVVPLHWTVTATVWQQRVSKDPYCTVS